MSGFQLEFKEQGGKRRKIILGSASGSGRGVERPLKFSAKMRHENSWINGAPSASMQILGPEIDPTTFKGRWSDRFIQQSPPDQIVMVDGQQVASAQDAAHLFDDVRAQGQLIQFTWGKEQRWGILHHFEYEYDPGVEDVRWSAEFVWSSYFDDRTGPMPAVTISVQDTLNRMQAAVSDAELRVGFNMTGLSTLPKDQSVGNASFIDRVKQGVGALRSRCNEIGSQVSAYVAQTKSYVDLAQSTVSKVAQAEADARDLVEVTQARVYAELTGFVDVGQATVGQSVACAAWARSIADNGGTFRAAALDFAQSTQSKYQSNILAEHTGRQGEHLRRVSLDYYDSVDHWQDIMVFNELTAPVLYAGQKIYIPKLQGV